MKLFNDIFGVTSVFREPDAYEVNPSTYEKLKKEFTLHPSAVPGRVYGDVTLFSNPERGLDEVVQGYNIRGRFVPALKNRRF